MSASPTSNTPIWNDREESQRPALTADVRADACVVGLGAAGLSAVLELASTGRSVVGIDAGRIGGGASGRNGGILRAGSSHFYHDAVALLGRERARRLYELTADEITRTELDAPGTVRRTGSLRIAADEREWNDCALQLQALAADGFDAREVETPAGRGIFVSGNAAFQPGARCRALAARAVDHARVQLFEHTAATKIGPGEVATGRGRVDCDIVIVTVDGDIESLVPALAGIVRTTRLQMLATEPATDVSIAAPVSYNHGFDYWQQLPDGRIALGGGRDRAMDREWGAAAEPDGEIQRYLESVLRERIGTRARITHRWAARVGYTESGLPVLEQVAPNVWATGGHCGTGNLLGPLCGRAAAQLADGQSAELAALLAEPVAVTREVSA